MEARRAFSVAVYARRGDRVLVIEHRRLATWLPIGGELEAGETPLEAAIRELREETGLTANFPAVHGALDGVPRGLIGYEEHQAGSKGLHLSVPIATAHKLAAMEAPEPELEPHGLRSSRYGFRVCPPRPDQPLEE